MKRQIVPTTECTVCQLVEDCCERHGHDDAAQVFARGYVAGQHACAKGKDAEERYCVKHAALLDRMMAIYTSKPYN